MIDKIAIVTSGFLPIPAAKGGAVENLIVNMINMNEIEKKEKFLIYSVYDKKALDDAKTYKYTNFKFIKINCFVKFMDKIIHFFAQNILNKVNSQSYRFILQRLYYLNKVSIDLKKNDYKKVLLENHPSQFLCLKWRKNWKKYEDKYYYHCHNEFPSEYGCHNIIIKSKKIICVSDYIKKTVSNSIKCPDNNFYVLRNGIDKKKFSEKLNESEKRELYEKYKISNDDIIIIFTGRIVPEKGIYELLQSVKQIKQKNFKLLIIGKPLNEINTKTEYEKKIENSLEGIEDKIIFTGFIKYEEINKMYKIANFAVIPSIWDDPAPLTIIESLVSGLPIITTNSGGIPEYATDGSAIIIDRDANLIKNLSKAIESLLNNENKRKKMSEISRKVSETLSVEEYYSNFIKFMSE